MSIPSGTSASASLVCALTGIWCVCLQINLRTEVLVDAMGSFSPIANQSRQGTKPDSVVLMVGSCAQGLPPCSTADLLYSFTPINRCASSC